MVALTEIEVVVYLSVFLLSLFFTLLASLKKVAIPCFLSWLCWYALAMFHLAFLYDSTFLTMLWIYLAIGTIFFVYGLTILITNMQDAVQRREMEIT